MIASNLQKNIGQILWFLRLSVADNISGITKAFLERNRADPGSGWGRVKRMSLRVQKEYLRRRQDGTEIYRKDWDAREPVVFQSSMAHSAVLWVVEMTRAGKPDISIWSKGKPLGEKMKTLWKYKFWIGGAFCLVVIGLIIGAIRPKHVSGAQPGASADVEVVQVEQKDVPIYSEWIGTLDGFTNADVRAQVTGYLMRQGYQEGAFVKKGQLLFEIDPRPFQAALDQTQGQLAQATAQLANAQAVEHRTELDVNRYTPLAKEQAASQQDLDNAIQNDLAAKATVATAEAQIKTAEAAVETANINLDFTRLVAPIDGIAGQAQLQVGDLVNPSSGPVTSVSTVDPIKVYFTVGEPQYLAWRKRFPTETTREAADKNLRLELILADGSIYPHEGTFYFADRQVNESTGAIRIAGLFTNPGNILRPGGYGKIRAVVRVQQDALLVPQRAVSELQGGYQVAVVDEEKKVSIRTVSVGERVGSEWIIADGLKRGESVVAEGVQKVRPGMLVNPKPFTVETAGR
ncbi:MAG: efflux RND transporter periplasmic adaptor subunit [Candidatus Acidiferrales bacterium]